MKFVALIAACFALTLSGCKNNSSPDPVKPPVDVVPQYGTPFAGVPATSDAVIYQVNIRAFSPGGNFAGVIARLDSIQKLGANVIYLMPIHPVGFIQSVNSPYCVRDYTAVNTEFGTLDDLRAVVDGAHARHIAVMMDWVANHTSWDNAWIKDHPEWYLKNASGAIISPPNTNFTDVAQLDFTNPAMRLEMIKDMKYWVLTANVDGFRCDFADNPPASFWSQAIDTLRNIKTHKLLLLAEGSRSANFASGFDYNFGFSFYGQLRSIFGSSQAVTALDQINTLDYSAASPDQYVVRYLNNHDVNSSDGTALESFGGKDGSLGAFVVAAYMKGVPMIYNGQEVADPVRITFPFTTVKIDWSTSPDVTAKYKKIIAFHNSSEAVRKGQLTSFSNNDICAFTKVLGGDTVIVIANMRNSSKTITVPSYLTKSYHLDAMSNSSTILRNPIEVPAYAWLVLKSN